MLIWIKVASWWRANVGLWKSQPSVYLSVEINVRQRLGLLLGMLRRQGRLGLVMKLRGIDGRELLLLKGRLKGTIRLESTAIRMRRLHLLHLLWWIEWWWWHRWPLKSRHTIHHLLPTLLIQPMLLLLEPLLLLQHINPQLLHLFLMFPLLLFQFLRQQVYLAWLWRILVIAASACFWRNTT